MTQNTSHAVMAQRHEPADSFDFFPTPAWATRALCEWMKRGRVALQEQICLEPACGLGHMARPLAEYFAKVDASDVCDRGFGSVADFLFAPKTLWSDWIITNPPFRLAEEFAGIALPRARHGVALLVRTAFLESVARYNRLFRHDPPTDILQFVERVPMFKGRVDPEGSTATAYCWIVWHKAKRHNHTNFHWIPPCRKRLERPEDYAEVSTA